MEDSHAVTTVTEAVDKSPPPPKSDGQKLLDRQLAVRRRLRNAVDRLDEVKASIAAPSFTHAGDSSTSLSATSFFEGLALMTDEFERVAGEIETSIEDLARLF